MQICQRYEREIAVKNLFAREFSKIWIIVLFVSAFVLMFFGTALIIFGEPLMKMLIYIIGFGLFSCGVVSLVLAIYLLGHTAVCWICRKK